MRRGRLFGTVAVGVLFGVLVGCPLGQQCRAGEIRKREKILAYTVKIDDIDRKSFAKGSGATAIVTFTIEPTKYAPQSVEMILAGPSGTQEFVIEDVTTGGQFPTDLVEGVEADLNTVGVFDVKIVVDDAESLVEKVVVWDLDFGPAAQAHMPRETNVDGFDMRIGIAEHIHHYILPTGFEDIGGAAIFDVAGRGDPVAPDDVGVTLAAHKSPGTATVTATVSQQQISKKFDVIAPSRVEFFNAQKDQEKNNAFFGPEGPPNNCIGQMTFFDTRFKPDTVSFGLASLQENVGTMAASL